MQIKIDNLDGNGYQDYTPRLIFHPKPSVTRRLNAPTLCQFSVLQTGAAPPPVSGGAVEIVDSSGNVWFAGRIARKPEYRAVGATEGSSSYLLIVDCMSNEVLLDEQANAVQNTLLGQSTQQQWQTLLQNVCGAALPLILSNQLAAAGRLEIAAGARWSETAALLANTTRSVYRNTGSSIAVSSLGEVVHAIAPDDPGLQFEGVSVGDLWRLATDVTVCGREEPTAYVTEVFTADGATAAYGLAEPYFSPAASQRIKLRDLFQGTSLNTQIWTVSDPGMHIALTAAGLTCEGGTGRDAESTVGSVQHIELGGTVVVEADGVSIAVGSEGYLLGLYGDSVSAANCFAAFQVSSTGSSTLLSAWINGAQVGASLAAVPGHMYTLRLRVYCPEVVRAEQAYYFFTDTGTGTAGGKLKASPGRVQFEVQDATSGVAGAPAVLYAGSVAALPASCLLGLLNSGGLVCSVKSVGCTQTSPLWVAVGPTESALVPQYIDTPANGGSCRVSAENGLSFYPANLPAAGQLIYVNYRLKERAIARQLLQSGGPATSGLTWIGSVERPIPWTRADCENAAMALAQMASSSSALVRGTYKCLGGSTTGDIWPGDALVTTSPVNGEPITAFARSVEITFSPDDPDFAEYNVAFANDVAESISLRVSSTIPDDIQLPLQATTIGQSLASLSGLVVTGVSGTTVTFSAGIEAPVNGGFEVRRRDDTFGPGTDSDLVLRTATSTISIPRSSAVEQYFIRMFDGASPPNYSLFSAALFLNVPTQ